MTHSITIQTIPHSLINHSTISPSTSIPPSIDEISRGNGDRRGLSLDWYLTHLIETLQFLQLIHRLTALFTSALWHYDGRFWIRVWMRGRRMEGEWIKREDWKKDEKMRWDGWNGHRRRSEIVERKQNKYLRIRGCERWETIENLEVESREI